MERTLILLKPDAVQRNLIGRIIARIENKGLKLVGLKMRQFPTPLIQQHYAVHSERPFYNDLVGFMTSGPVVAMAIEGKNAITVMRTLIGKTNSAEADPGTIRGDLGMSFSNNLVHGSDSAESAATELALFFGDDDEICSWTPAAQGWVYSAEEGVS